MKKTYTPKKSEIKRAWHLIDAQNKVLGRIATDIATLLIGKNKPNFSNHVNVGDHVVVVNAEKVAVTGKKKKNKTYYRNTGYPGGIKSQTMEELLEKKPTEVLKKAIYGMLPKNKLRDERMKNLHIYAGPKHPHEGQIK
jgi:large subunit ribosomal protein L13